jgi:LysR family transcriptional regulator, hypochlorite-specific transcription factor HypT
MDLKWLDDLVALAEAGSLTQAAGLRNITQPAFTRRVQQIEQWLGVPVIDRSVRPARVSPAVMRKIEDIRALTGEFRQLRRDMLDWEASQRRVSIASQHSLSAGVLPRFIAKLQKVRPVLSIRLRSANRDDCYTLLMTRQASILVIYEVEGLPIAPDEMLIERKLIGIDELCAVASPDRRDAIASSRDGIRTLPVIGYPPDVFFGMVFTQRILPGLQAGNRLDVRCETALVPSALSLAMEGVGVAWLPRTLCAPFLASGALAELGPSFGSAEMQIVSARLSTPRPQHAETVWSQLAVYMAETIQRN